MRDPDNDEARAGLLRTGFDRLRAHLPGNDLIWRKFVQGGAISLLLQLASIGLRFAVTVALTRSLGVEDYGLYAFVFAIVQLVSDPLVNGGRRITVRLTAEYQATSQWGMLAGLRQRGRLLLMLAAVIGGLAVWLGRDLFADHYGTAAADALVIGSCFPLLMAIVRFHEGLLRGCGHIGWGQFPGLVLRPLILALLLGAGLYLLGPGALDATAAFRLNAAALAAVALISFWNLEQVYPREARQAVPVHASAYWARAAAPLMVVASFQLVQTNGSVLVAGALATPTDVAMLNTAQRLAELVDLVQFVAAIAAEPLISRLHAQGDRRRLARLITQTARGIMVLTLVVAAVVILARHPLLGIFGEGFGAAAPILVVMVLGEVASASVGLVAAILAMTGHPGAVVRATGLGAVSNIVLGVLLVPPLGGMGAALAYVLSLIPIKLYMWWQVRAKLGLDASCLGLAPIGPDTPAR